MHELEMAWKLKKEKQKSEKNQNGEKHQTRRLSLHEIEHFEKPHKNERAKELKSRENMENREIKRKRKVENSVKSWESGKMKDAMTLYNHLVESEVAWAEEIVCEIARTQGIRHGEIV